MIDDEYIKLANVCELEDGWAFVTEFQARVQDQLDETWPAYLYVLLCADDTLYVGFTTNIRKRMAAHASQSGAHYTRARLPVHLVWLCGVPHGVIHGKKWQAEQDEERLRAMVNRGKFPAADLNEDRIDRLNIMMAAIDAKRRA